MPEDSNSHTLGVDETGVGTLRATRNTAGEYTATIGTDDETESTTVVVESEGQTAELYGYVRAQYGNQTVNIPVYNPDTIDYPCWRVQIDETTTGAFHIDDRESADFRAFSIETAGGPKGISQVEEETGVDVSLSTSAPSSIQDDENLNVDVTMENAGVDTATGSAVLEMNNVELDSHSYSIEGESSTNYTLTGGPFQSGTYNWIVNTDHGSETGELNVEQDRYLIDDFEHNNLSNYYTLGDLSHYSTHTGWSYDGSYALRNNTDYYGTMISSFSGLDTYPQQGDRINMIFRTNFDETTADLSRPSIRFGHQDHDAFYECRLRIDNTPRLIIAENTPEIDGWNTIRVQDIDLTLPSQTNLMFSVVWGQDNISMRIYNEETGEAITPSISGAPEYHSATSGGIGISLESESSSNVMFADHIHVE